MFRSLTTLLLTLWMPLVVLAQPQASSSRRFASAPGGDRDAVLSEEIPRPVPSLRPLSLADIEQIALRKNPTLAAAAARIEEARGRFNQAGRYPNPVVGYHGTEIGNLGTPGQQGGFVSQRLITGGKRRLDKAIASQQILEAKVGFDAQEWRVLNDVRIRFYYALVAKLRVDLTRELMLIGDKMVEYSENLHQARQLSENDLLLAEIEAETIRIQYNNAKNDEIESWRRLTAVIGVPALKASPLEGNLKGSFVRFQWNEVLGSLLATSPEINAARIRVKQAQFVASRARRQPIPNVDLSVSVRHIYPTDSDVANVQAGIPLPIFDANQGNIYKADWDVATSEAEVARLELDLQNRLAIAFRRYDNADQQVEWYKKRILPRANKSLELVTNAYSQGQTDYITLLTSQRTYNRVNLAYLQSLLELRETAVIIEGQLLSDSLARPEW
ncbi:MAG: TolC family protein [Planctomycetales bacterium]